MHTDGTTQFVYIALQYSGIQKVILRHDRLWSISGLSQILSAMNEIDLPAYTRKYGGQDLLSGGGKFDAKFSSKKNASLALNEIKKTLATTLPMLEFQVSAIVTASSFMDAKDRLTADLAKNKMHFRGYGVSFNPHFSECSECGEYPATSGLEIKGNKVCQTCFIAYENSRNIAGIGETEGLTSIQKILKSYIERDPNALDQRQFR